MTKRIGVIAKGMCMGIADIIPGVSGGTMALILGIYRQFIEAVKSINARPAIALVRWAASGFDAQRRAELGEAMDTVHWRFLLPLGIGIATAMAIGSLIIPTLLENYPEVMRGLFFGLILASVRVPLVMIPRERRSGIVAATLAAVLACVGGYVVTDPNRILDATSSWVEVTVPGDATEMTLQDVARKGPSSLNTEEIYWAPENEALRAAVAAAAPVRAGELAALRGESGATKTDKKALKQRARPYNDLIVPAGTAVSVPRPSHVFILFAGAIAISAMVLPGISGSFILLILGCYYFMLNAVKGSVAQLAHLEFPAQAIAYVILFITGLVIGLLTFSRVLSYLLRNRPAPTMGALVGLMVGCLRGIWPYRETAADGAVSNVMPASWGGTEIAALIAAVAGVALVAMVTRLGRRLEAAQGG